MESKIPLPTDNIYKFYALFGLLLFISSSLSVIWVGSNTNENLYSLVKEYEAIPGAEEEKEKSPLAKVIERRIEVQIENKKIFIIGLGIVSGIAVLLMWFGFKQWQTKIQPKQDEYFDLQLQKLKQEIENNQDNHTQSKSH